MGKSICCFQATKVHCELLSKESWHLLPCLGLPREEIFAVTPNHDNIDNNVITMLGPQSPILSLPIMLPNPEAPTADAPHETQSIDNQRVTPVSMPPPAQVTMFAPPPLPTYTLKQLLDHPVQTPSAPSGISAGVLAAQTNRPTHSSARALQYEWIDETTLHTILGVEIANFRKRIDSMESIKFGHSLALPWEASPMLSEGCVTGYLDAQVLGAAWQAVLQLLPKERDYDLQMVKQVPATVSLCGYSPELLYLLLLWTILISGLGWNTRSNLLDPTREHLRDPCCC